eukprot:gene10542-biopygen22824
MPDAVQEWHAEEVICEVFWSILSILDQKTRHKWLERRAAATGIHPLAPNGSHRCPGCSITRFCGKEHAIWPPDRTNTSFGCTHGLTAFPAETGMSFCARPCVSSMAPFCSERGYPRRCGASFYAPEAHILLAACTSTRLRVRVK